MFVKEEYCLEERGAHAWLFPVPRPVDILEPSSRGVRTVQNISGMPRTSPYCDNLVLSIHLIYGLHIVPKKKSSKVEVRRWRWPCNCLLFLSTCWECSIDIPLYSFREVSWSAIGWELHALTHTGVEACRTLDLMCTNVQYYTTLFATWERG